MSYEIDAIYDNGVFRPLEPVAIPAGVRVQLRILDGGSIVDSKDARSEIGRKDHAELNSFRRVMSELPIESPIDGFSGADHDQLLYGKP